MHSTLSPRQLTNDISTIIRLIKLNRLKSIDFFLYPFHAGHFPLKFLRFKKKSHSPTDWLVTLKQSICNATIENTQIEFAYVLYYFNESSVFIKNASSKDSYYRQEYNRSAPEVYIMMQSIEIEHSTKIIVSKNCAHKKEIDYRTNGTSIE